MRRTITFCSDANSLRIPRAAFESWWGGRPGSGTVRSGTEGCEVAVASVRVGAGAVVVSPGRIRMGAGGRVVAVGG